MPLNISFASYYSHKFPGLHEPPYFYLEPPQFLHGSWLYLYFCLWTLPCLHRETDIILLTMLLSLQLQLYVSEFSYVILASLCIFCDSSWNCPIDFIILIHTEVVYWTLKCQKTFAFCYYKVQCTVWWYERFFYICIVWKISMQIFQMIKWL